MLISRKSGKPEELKEGVSVILKLAMDGKTVLEITAVQPRGERDGQRPAAPREGRERPGATAGTIEGEIKAVDAKASTITLPGVRGGDDRTFTLGSEVKVTINGKSARVANLTVGGKATLKLDREGKTVVEITVGGERPAERRP